MFFLSSTKTTKKEDVLPGKFAYITTKNTFNGYEKSSHIWTENENVITVDSATNGNCFFQENKFTASDHVEKIWPIYQCLNRYNSHFLTSLLNFNSYKYSYGRKRSLREIRKEKLLLPTINGEPDWKFMENSIKDFYQKIINKFKLELERLSP